MSINVTYPADYPAVEVCGPNPSLARLLNNDLSAAKKRDDGDPPIHLSSLEAGKGLS